MKLMKGKKVAFATTLSMVLSTAAVNAVATVEQQQKLSRGLGDWIIIVAELLSVLCLVVFAVYMGRYVTLVGDKKAELDDKTVKGVHNGIVTTLVGIAICQAAMIVSKICF